MPSPSPSLSRADVVRSLETRFDYASARVIFKMAMKDAALETGLDAFDKEQASRLSKAVADLAEADLLAAAVAQLAAGKAGDDDRQPAATAATGGSKKKGKRK